MRFVAVVLSTMLLTSCVSNQMKGERDAPDLAPMTPARDVSVETSGDLMCVTEKDNPAGRTCVPRVHEDDG